MRERSAAGTYFSGFRRLAFFLALAWASALPLPLPFFLALAFLAAFAAGHLRARIAPLERKSGWTLAEQAGHVEPDRVHRLLNSCAWSADEVLDDAGLLKKGHRSAGVQRQYSGTAGRTENGQIGVSLAYASRRGRTELPRVSSPPGA
jgi:hypothetical protein